MLGSKRFIEMKWFWTLFLCITASAQLPVIPYPVPSGLALWPGCAATNAFDFSTINPGSLYVELFTDCTNADWTGHIDQTAPQGVWIDQTTNHNNFPNGPNTSVTWSNTMNSVFAPYLDWTTGSTPASQRCLTTLSNQPNTVIIVANFGSAVLSTTVATLFDDFNNAGEFVQIANNASGTMSAGTAITLPVISQFMATNYAIFTFCFNGANSYARTNGVLWASGNSGARAIGRMMIGLNAGQTLSWRGQVRAVLVYNAALVTNDLFSAESHLSTKYGTTPAIPHP